MRFGPATLSELVATVLDAYGLRGRSTAQIAAELRLSSYTVQKHLLGSNGIRSRRELVTTIFFEHYHPNLATHTSRLTA